MILLFWSKIVCVCLVFLCHCYCHSYWAENAPSVVHHWWSIDVYQRRCQMILLRLCKLILATVQVVWYITDTWLDINGVEPLHLQHFIWFIWSYDSYDHRYMAWHKGCGAYTEIVWYITDTFPDIKSVVRICHQRSKRSGGVGHIGWLTTTHLLMKRFTQCSEETEGGSQPIYWDGHTLASSGLGWRRLENMMSWPKSVLQRLH